MAIIEWSDGLEINVPEIDQQHRQYVTLMNDLHQAVEARQEKAALIAIVARMVNHGERQFVDEEALMYRVGYPQLQAHRTAHRRHLDRVLEFKSEIQKSGATSAQEMLLYLKNWVITHFQHEDNGYGQFIAKQKDSTQKIPTAAR